MWQILRGPRTFHSTDKYKRVVWQCKTKLKKGHKCETPDLNPKDIESIFIEAFNKLLENKDEVISDVKEFIKSIDDPEVMEKEKAKLCGESQLIYTKIKIPLQQYLKNISKNSTLNFYSFDDFKKRLTVHSRKYNRFSTRPPLNRLSPSDYINYFLLNVNFFNLLFVTHH